MSGPYSLFHSMPPFRPGLWPTVAAVVVIAATVSLGNWQYGRANAKAALQAQAAAARAQPPVTVRSLRDIDPAMRYRQVEANGAFVPDLQVWIDNRTYKRQVGYYVLTPLRLADGSHVIVNRGWIAAPKIRDSIPPAVPPDGPMRVVGALNTPPPSFLALGEKKPSGRVWQNFDIDEYARIHRIDVAPLVIEQRSTPADGLVRDWPVPLFGRDTNISYMWQWWSFGALALIFWVVLGFRAGRTAAAGSSPRIPDGQ